MESAHILRFTCFALFWCLRVYSLQVTPVKPNVVGVLGGSVQFQWLIFNRRNKYVDLWSLNVHKGTSDNGVRLFSFNGYQLHKIENTTDRLNATIIGDINTDIETTYYLVLKNIQFEDENTSFFLSAVFEDLFQMKLLVAGSTVQLVAVKGGPEFCHGGFPSNFTFDNYSSPRILITLCGVPQPVLQGKFIGQKLIVIYTTVNRYTHNFTLQLPLLTQRACGKELQVTATGHNGTLSDSTKIFVRNCNSGVTQRSKSGSSNTITSIILVIVSLVGISIAVIAIIMVKKKRKRSDCKSKERAGGKNYLEENINGQNVKLNEAPQYSEIGVSMNAKPASSFINMRKTNGMNLDNQTSHYVNQQLNYANRSCFCINRSNSKTNCYDVPQGIEWTRNDYQYLQGMGQGTSTIENTKQVTKKSKEEDQGTSDYVPMHSSINVKQYSLPCKTGGDERASLSHYMNPRINHAIKPSNKIHRLDVKVNNYSTLQQSSLSERNYEQLKD